MMAVNDGLLKFLCSNHDKLLYINFSDHRYLQFATVTFVCHRNRTVRSLGVIEGTTPEKCVYVEK